MKKSSVSSAKNDSMQRIHFLSVGFFVLGFAFFSLVVAQKHMSAGSVEYYATPTTSTPPSSLDASVVDSEEERAVEVVGEVAFEVQEKTRAEQKKAIAEAKAIEKEKELEELRERKREERKQEALKLKEDYEREKAARAKTRPEQRVLTQYNAVRKAGVYLSAGNAGNDEFLDETIANLKASGGSAFVFDVKGPYVYFESTVPYATELNLVRPLYALPEIVAKAKENGIYSIARFVAANDSVFSYLVPEARIRHPQTNVAVGTKWVDLSKPETLRYNREILQELAASGVDEINIDYIRYPTEYSLASIGLTVEEKSANVTTFVKMARDVIEESGTDTNLGVSTYAILGWNYEVNLNTLGQDFVGFADYVDVISPMAYPSTFQKGAYYNPAIHPGSRMYYLVYNTLMGYKELLGPDHAHKLRPWIQGYFIYNQDLKDEIQAVYDAGSCGFTIWSAGNYYDIFYKVFPEMTIPENCA